MWNLTNTDLFHFLKISFSQNLHGTGFHDSKSATEFGQNELEKSQLLATQGHTFVHVSIKMKR